MTSLFVTSVKIGGLWSLLSLAATASPAAHTTPTTPASPATHSSPEHAHAASTHSPTHSHPAQTSQTAGNPAPHSHQHPPATAAETFSFGAPGRLEQVSRRIEVTLTDAMRFELPANFSVQAGETLLFVVHNRGRLAHELTLGDPAEQRRHAAMMQQSTHLHQHANSLHLGPGETGQLIWTFSGDAQAELELGCHLPGHYQAGMRYRFRLVPAS